MARDRHRLNRLRKDKKTQPAEIEKLFQHGGEKLRAEGVRIESLAAIESMEPGVIRFGWYFHKPT